MKEICSKCNWEIIPLNFSEEERLEIWYAIQNNMSAFAIMRIKAGGSFNDLQAKNILAHLNRPYGHCVNCNFNALNRENTQCSKCKSFNYNWKIDPPFNQQFCAELEHSLDFDHLNDKNLWGFWCDGVDHLPADVKQLASENIRNKQEIVTKAWIGKDGQDHYDMAIKLGPVAVEKYLAGQNLSDCLPPKEIKIAPEEKYIEVSLN